MSSFRLSAVSLVLLLSCACGGSYSSPAPTPTPTPTPSGASLTVSIPMGASTLTNTAYVPNVADVAVGTTVVWNNTDSVPHTSTSNSAVWNSNTIAAGGSFSFTFQSAGTFPYHCTIHPGMVGSVVVR